MKTYFNKAMDNLMITYPNRSIKVQNINTLTEREFGQSTTVANITSGFCWSGIFPINVGIFTKADYVPIDVTDRPQTVVNEQDYLIQLSQVHLSQLYSRFQSTIQARLILLVYWQGLPLRMLLLHWWWLPLSSLDTSRYFSLTQSCSTQRWSTQKKVGKDRYTDKHTRERIEQEWADKLTKGKKQPKRRPIQKEPESCSEEDEQNYIVPLETGSDLPSKAKA